ncbi:GGDEF domain-containing phosphodiesterase [uncultured Pseudokineococcus sp.]|uniref:GGDEF domain-containing phosphodiesterase n=1 Tax=uncultured Pseudokineococcus sp. TaxID=1642928 RepID=UPI0026243C5A|nr:GGDEF domain-containing phosphodiesterase [uncultured Pseudokineococcus sp.]
MGAGGSAPAARRPGAPAGAAVVVGALGVVATLLSPAAVRGWVVLAVLLPSGPLVALAVRRFAPQRRTQWLLVAAAGAALSAAWLGVLLTWIPLASAAMLVVYLCLGTSAHLALGTEGRRGWVLAVDVAAIAVVGAAGALWVRGLVGGPAALQAALLAAGDLVLLAYLVALLHSRARVTASVAALVGSLAALELHHVGMWIDPGDDGASPWSSALVVAAVLAVTAAWHPSMAAFGDVVSPLVAPRRQVLVMVPAVVGLLAAVALAALGVLPPPPPAVVPVVAVAALAAVLLMTTSFTLSAEVDREQLETDPLTRAGSRVALERLLGAQIHQGTAPVHLVVVELDEVSVLARRQGRQAADELLVRRVRDLAEGLPDAVVCRTGPQTLAVVAPTASRVRRDETPLGLVAAVRAQLGAPVGESGRAPSTTAAVLTVPPRAEVSPGGLSTREIVSALLRHAELSLLVARDRGVPVEADVARDGAYERARRLDSDLAAALAGVEQIAVHYQPLVDPRTGAVRSLEALVRWEHPELGPVPPDDFLWAASLQGRARDLDDLARRRALEDFAGWRAAGVEPEHVAVNLSAQSLESPDLVERVTADLAASGVEPEHLVLEVVEQEELRDLRAVAERLVRLRRLGLGVAVDDFGVGHAALQYLLHLPVTAVKLDRSLVAEVLTPAGRALLGSAVALSSSLGAEAVAEGVESAEQMRAVADLGFALAQGYYCGRPRPADETAALLATHGAGRGAAAPTPL